MTEQPHLVYLIETVALEAKHLLETDSRLFALPFDRNRARVLRADPNESERTDAFVACFGRLQDTVADKLLPEFLRCLAEPVGAAVDNLDRVEKLGLLNSADEWLASRKLRNRMVHEYVRDATELAAALNQGHALVPMLVSLARAIESDHRCRWLIST